jgi:uncharacterized protein
MRTRRSLGAITDLQANDILRRVVEPPLQGGRYREAIDEGVTAIAAALSAGTTPGPSRPPPPPAARRLSSLEIAGLFVLIVAFIVLMIVSSTFRSAVWFIANLLGMFASNDRGGGSGGSGGSGYSGGGGRSGGGGSSDGY